jgi:hypothetical protein
MFKWERRIFTSRGKKGVIIGIRVVMTLLEKVILAHKYLYYFCGSSILSDEEFDYLYQQLPLDSCARIVGYREPISKLEQWAWISREGREALLQATTELLRKGDV